jgi:hypothetical protein
MLGKSLNLEVTGHRLLEICCRAAFNDMRIKIKGTPVRYDDTVATYALSVDSYFCIRGSAHEYRDGKTLNQKRTVELLAFLRGIIACCKSM